MADSKFDICNKALVLVGANTISSFTQNTTESKVANQLYESTLENLLTRCRWRFASKQAQLSKNTTNPDARYDSSYALPSDAHIIHTVTVGDDIIKYDRYGQNLFTNTTSSDTVIADYTFQPSESIFPPYFKQTLVFELASLFAGAIARNDQLSELYHKRSIAQLAIAKATDGQAQTTRRLNVDRFRNVRNRTALNDITATSP
ncbi:conserved protein of unknown function [uncultured Mediterranean phage uvMED]|jgi:hypothetical protein|nr:conserved protein of unknown function [uncultured Mediterranean phage uvMED]|tara:strand:- start:217 stop:825 length:609 start_codon:yes stop_codon:yes gene_type:complete